MVFGKKARRKLKKAVIGLLLIAVSIILLFIVLVWYVVIGLPDKWNSYHYNLSESEVRLSDYQSQDILESFFTSGFLFSIKLVGTNEGSFSGESPFKVAVTARSNSESLEEWRVLSAEIFRVGMPKHFVSVDNGNYAQNATKSTGLSYGKTVVYHKGTWSSDYEIELDQSIDAVVRLLVVVEVLDELGAQKKIVVEREFKSEIKRGWFKMKV